MSEHKPFKPPMPTAPQPEVLPRETNAIMEALEIRESELLDRIAALEASNGNAFVSGAAWMGGFSADFSAKQAARAEAERRGFVFKASRETFLESKIATLEAQLAEAQARLAMAAEALNGTLGELQAVQATCALSGLPAKAWAGFGGKAKKALDATADSVAQHTASVERRGAAKAVELLDSCLPWLGAYYGYLCVNEHHPESMVNLLATLQTVLRFLGNEEGAERFQGDMDKAKARAAELEGA